MSPSQTNTAAVIASLMTALLLGCGAPPMKSYYTLENNTAGKSTTRAAALCKLPLAVDPVNVAPPYDLTKVVFRPDDLEVRYYANRYWVTAPEEMMTKLVIRRLESESLFSSVDASVHVSGSHLTMIVKLHNLEEMDREGVWHGRIAMHFILKDEMEEITLCEHHFDVIRQVPNMDIKSVVKVLNDIFNDEMDVLVKSLEAFFKSHGGCGLRHSDDDEDRPYD